MDYVDDDATVQRVAGPWLAYEHGSGTTEEPRPDRVWIGVDGGAQAIPVERWLRARADLT